ncbi:MAG: hypothetical protein RL757_1452 [Bacteroidota bacterium]
MKKAFFPLPQRAYRCERNHRVKKKRPTLCFTRPSLVCAILYVISALTVGLGATEPVKVPQLWQEIALPSRSEDSILNVLVERHRYLPFVKRAILVETNAALLHNEKVAITVGGHSATIQTLLGENDKTQSFIRYGGLFDDRLEKNDPAANIGEVFFAVQNGLIASKFYFEDEIYALIPIYKHYHLLLQLNAMRLPNECGTVHHFGATPPENPASADYRLRVLVAFSQVAISSLKHYSLTMTPEHFAQLAIGENNLAHWRNPKRSPHLNLEKVAVLSYSELEMKRDLANLTAERPPFDLLQRWRTEAATDLQILIRSSEDALFGMARAEADGWSSGRAFCVMTLDGFGFTPYSLAHQIEHLRPDAIEPNDNTIAPSVFQSRLNQKNHNSSGVEKTFALDVKNSKVVKEESNGLKTRFFARHSIFYGDNGLLNTETIDSQLVKASADQFALLQYWDILPFNLQNRQLLLEDSFFVEKVGGYPNDVLVEKTPPAHLPQIVEILQNDNAPKEDEDIFTKKMDLQEFRIMPNPTHGETFLEYRVAKEGVPIRLDLVTLTGQFVARLAENANHPSGKFTVRWDAAGMPAGVYVCTLRIGDKVQVLRLVVE